MEPRGRQTSAARPLVLIADGHDDTRQLYRDVFEFYGFETAPYEDGAQALRHVLEIHPDIIVTELSFPRFNEGWSFIQNVKRDPRTRDIPIVVVTGDDQYGLREQAEREGCAAFFLKPCSAEQLAIQLRRVLNNAP